MNRWKMEVFIPNAATVLDFKKIIYWGKSFEVLENEYRSEKLRKDGMLVYLYLKEEYIPFVERHLEKIGGMIEHREDLGDVFETVKGYLGESNV